MARDCQGFLNCLCHWACVETYLDYRNIQRRAGPRGEAIKVRWIADVFAHYSVPTYIGMMLNSFQVHCAIDGFEATDNQEAVAEACALLALIQSRL